MLKQGKISGAWSLQFFSGLNHIRCQYNSSQWLSSEQETSEADDSSDEDSEDEQVRPESLSPEELEKLKEAVDERKKLIQSLRGKPWSMKKKLVTLR